MIFIYVPKVTNRLRFICGLIFRDLLGVEYKFTVNESDFKNFQGPKLSYCTAPVGDEIHITAKNILFETGLIDQEINIAEFNGEKIFFQSGKNAALPFDLFAASFFLVSRYEEYLPFRPDIHERFDAKESLAFQHGFLNKPLVNIWTQWLKNLLVERFPEIKFNTSKYTFVSTIDIDNAFAFKEKGLIRTIGGFIKSIVRFNPNEFAQRIKVMFNKETDPYDTYDFQLEMKRIHKFNLIYFFLLGDYGENDKNLSVDNSKFQSLIKKLGDYADIGIHPSYGSNKEPQRLKKEITRLSETLNREITKSRQHFLKLSFPHTYRNLLENDIKEDYTMGYASNVGFRASICSPFYFYDLDQELETQLKVYPFQVMEGTLKYYMKVLPEDAMSYIQPLIDEVKKVDGTFISLWHNDTLNDAGTWKGWRDVYIQMINKAKL